MKDAYIVSAVRTPGCRRGKGGLAETRPENLLAHVLDAAIERVPGLEKKNVDDIMIGCAFPEAEQGLNIGRIAPLLAGFPVSTSGATVNRFCAAGLESIAQSALRVMSGWSTVTMAGGIESMSIVPMGGNMPRPHPGLARSRPDSYISMGVTAENVANRYSISREDQDEFAVHSHQKAAEARENGFFTEIVPTPAERYVINDDGSVSKSTVTLEHDDGIRENSSVEGLAKLRAAFSATGSVTAGNSSQTTDGAAAVVIVNESVLKKYGLKPLAKLKFYTTTGCEPDEMGIGPALAIPKLLDMAGLSVKDIGLWELNEAFASQAIYCARELGIGDKKFWAADSPEKKLNISGGAIALGHPLGCTGSKLAGTLIANMQRLGVKYGVESMCVGGGMGAAALFELCE
ncbi:MAG: thiolase family protein [bacterium]|nr:thiolase family protein [bacterium]